MFSSAVKSLSSFSSNITANYSIAPTPTAICGPWKIFDAKKRAGGKTVSIFVFDRKSIEPPGGSIASRQGATSLKRAQDEVVERLRKEASALARLRHPSILELQEPVEDTRNGGLMFATEPVTASLAGLLEEKDNQEKAGGIGGRTSRFVVEDSEGGRRRRELEIDELEIQKGLLQIGKGLEFLHESAGLVHANLTPEAIFLNAKSDWKISGLGFSTPTDQSSNGATPTLLLSEALNYDARLPRSVQLDIDYASPDFVMDNNINTSADIFSLGLIIIALYNSPHRTPLNTNFSVPTYKRMLASPSTTPTQSNNYLSTRPIPKDVLTSVLPRLITRRPAQRLSAREFQQAQYFDSILVSTIRFLDSLPAKTSAEKSQFMRGLPRILSQFPKSVLEKKVLPALLDENKDHELLSLTLQNVFKVLALVPNSKRSFSEKVLPTLREIFLAPAKARKGQKAERDTSTDGGLMVVMEQMSVITENCSGKEFKDDILPIIFIALESAQHSLQDAALHGLPLILPILDFSTLKNEVFPVVAHVFSKTSSLAIKISGLQAFSILCGGGATAQTGSHATSTTSNGAVLDKYTIQEKVVPLLKAIKTKEPAVMIAALNVFQQAGKLADIEFLASDILPCLYVFSLGPLLNLEQFQAYMTLIKSLSAKIEQEQTRKLQNLSSTSRGGAGLAKTNGAADGPADTETDFESLVTGRAANNNTQTNGFDVDWSADAAPASSTTRPRPHQQQSASAATFAWSTPSAASQPLRPQAQTRASTMAMQPTIVSRTVTPDNTLSSFTTLSPARALQPSTITPAPTQSNTSVDWSTAKTPTPSNWSTPLQPQSYGVPTPQATTTMYGQTHSIPSMSKLAISTPAIAPPPVLNQRNGFPGAQQNGQAPKQGMDKYESLL